MMVLQFRNTIAIPNPVQDLDLELDLDELINLELGLVSNLILY